MSAAIAVDQGFKTGVERVEVVSSPMLEEAQATVKQSGKMFNILTRMYSRPVEAGVREITNNAIDANVEAGRPDAPVLIKMPKHWDTMFSVRDHGKSMSHEFMMNRYMNLGDSTKETDNTQTGFFGIGSKTPLALVDQYYVTCFQGGEQRIYSITRKTFDGDNGSYDTIPVVGHVATNPTTEADGTEVSWAVDADQSSQLAKAVTLTLAGAAGKANVQVERDGAITTDYNFTGEPRMFGKSWATYDTAVFSKAFGHNRAMIRVGRILYNLNIDAVLGDKTLDPKYHVIKHLFQASAIIDVPMSSVQVAPSREELEYTRTTVKFLFDHASAIIDEIVSDARADVDKATNIFEATRAFAAHSKDPRIVPFLSTTVKWRGSSINPQGVEIPKDFVDFGYHAVSLEFLTAFNGVLRPTSQTMRDRSSGNKFLTPTMDKLHVYITQYENAKTRFAKQRIIADCRKKGFDPKTTQILWLRRDLESNSQKGFDDLLASMNIPASWITEVKDLPVYIAPKRVAGPKVAKVATACNIRVFTSKNDKLRMQYMDLNHVNNQKPMIYVEMSNGYDLREITTPAGKKIYEEGARNLVKTAEQHIKSLTGEIYFIRKEFVDKNIKSRANWKTLWSVMKDELDTYRTTQADVDAGHDYDIKREVLSDFLVNLSTGSIKSALVGNFVILLKKAQQPAYQKQSVFSSLNYYLGDQNTQLKPNRTVLTDMKEQVETKYPLLKEFAELAKQFPGTYQAENRSRVLKLMNAYMETIK